MSKRAVQLFVKHVYRWNFEFNTMHISTFGSIVLPFVDI